MSQKKVLRQLLNTDNEYAPNISLLKKIMLTVYMGRLRINDQPPDRNFNLMDYLFDDERLVLDFTRLSDAHRQKFTAWLLDKHQNQKTRMASNASTNEYRGFTAEVALSWWGQFINWLFGNMQNQWPLADLTISMDYQLFGLEIAEGKKGMLIGFQQLLVPETDNKYYDAAEIRQESTGNMKRVYITDTIVDKLLKIPMDIPDFSAIYNKPHPQSVVVNDTADRFRAMHEYRQIQQFDYKPWYMELLDWVISWFVSEENPKSVQNKQQTEIELLFQAEGVSLYKRKGSEEIIVVEPRPDIDIMVYCGGGARMFAHVGVMQALEEAGIWPSRFAGSSAGAFIALMGYLGYESREVLLFLNQFKQENLVHYDINRNGLSNTTGLKSAVDFMIAKKVDEITKKYKIPHPEGPITFAVLDALREHCPGCGIGKELVVTATHMRGSQTCYFSLLRTPDKEVSEVVTASGSLPLLYRPMLIEGEEGLEEYNDGGILSNFPTEAFCDDKSTLLEAENGNNLKLLGVQFDNGTERSAIDNIMQRVYKENPILNGFYRLITGINDPASGWEQDRIKLRQHGMQVLIVKTGDVGTAKFDLTEAEKTALILNGYSETREYIKTRYNAGENAASNDELMYTSFHSLGDFLSYCCYRNQKKWFDRACMLIEKTAGKDKKALLDQAKTLHELHFNDYPEIEKSATPAFFKRSASAYSSKMGLKKAHYDQFRALYPLCLAMSSVYIQDKNAKAVFEKICHGFHLQTPLHSLGAELAKIKGKTHILFHLTVLLLQQLTDETASELYETIADLTEIYKTNDMLQPQCFGHWHLEEQECKEVLDLFRRKNSRLLVAFCDQLQAKNRNIHIELQEPSPEKTVLPLHLMGRVIL